MVSIIFTNDNGHDDDDNYYDNGDDVMTMTIMMIMVMRMTTMKMMIMMTGMIMMMTIMMIMVMTTTMVMMCNHHDCNIHDGEGGKYGVVKIEVVFGNNGNNNIDKWYPWCRWWPTLPDSWYVSKHECEKSTSPFSIKSYNFSSLSATKGGFPVKLKVTAKRYHYQCNSMNTYIYEMSTTR